MNKILPLCLLLGALSACNSSDDDKDMTLPTISDPTDETACPTDCQVFHPGDEIPFCYLFTDDIELGNYNIEIHNNFDHHTHSTSSVECELDARKTASDKAWVFSESYAIPAGQKSFLSHQFISIPETVEVGDYHFMIKLTDQSGWQQYKAVAIKIQ
ncbi:MAG: DUF4625 domain-containing protein [Bacteroidales bacterium]|nr:DUF4625 domain-containing protein [Bacteroidales bacterium]